MRLNVLVTSRSHQVLCGNIDSITLGMPGSALSDHTLADVDLPHVQEMVGDSLEACCMFKRQAAVPERAPSAPPVPQDTGILTDLDGNYHHSLPGSYHVHNSPAPPESVQRSFVWLQGHVFCAILPTTCLIQSLSGDFSAGYLQATLFQPRMMTRGIPSHQVWVRVMAHVFCADSHGV